MKSEKPENDNQGEEIPFSSYKDFLYNLVSRIKQSLKKVIMIIVFKIPDMKDWQTGNPSRENEFNRQVYIQRRVQVNLN